MEEAPAAIEKAVRDPSGFFYASWSVMGVTGNMECQWNGVKLTTPCQQVDYIFTPAYTCNYIKLLDTIVG